MDLATTHSGEEPEILSDIAPILKTYQRLKPYLTTLSPAQYNHYKDKNLPPAHSILQKTNKTWEQILQILELPLPLDRDTLSRLGLSLHLLEKKLLRVLGLGWDEKTFTISGHKRLRPDSFYQERAYLQNRQLLILDIKLSLSSSFITIYKYLPIFENPPVPMQKTFFSDWLPKEAAMTEPGYQIQPNGQIELSWENNLLYICYLIGGPQKDLLPCSEISFGRVDRKKKKKLPSNMEIRFVPFIRLPELYCQIAGIPYNHEIVEPILQMAEEIKQLVLHPPNNISQISKEIYRKIKQER